MLSQFLEQYIDSCVQQVLTEPGAQGILNAPVQLEQPINPAFGDYASNTAMQLAEPLREAPRNLTERIASRLREAGMANRLLQRVEIAGPGFINLHINREEWAKREFSFPCRNTTEKNHR